MPAANLHNDQVGWTSLCFFNSGSLIPKQGWKTHCASSRDKAPLPTSPQLLCTGETEKKGLNISCSQMNHLHIVP